jgi:hypothetical protein
LTSSSGRLSVAVISRPPFSDGHNWKTCSLPLRQPVFKPSGTKAGLLQDTDRLMGERTVRAAAVGHDFFVAGQFAESSAEFRKRDRDRRRQVACRKFLGWPDVQHDQVFTPLQPTKQFRARDRLKTVPGAEVSVGQFADLRTVLGSHAAQVAPQVEHLRIPELVVDASTVPPAADQTYLTEQLQVLTGVRNGEPGLRCQALDRALAVGEDVDDLEAPPVRQRLRQPGELIKQRRFGCPAVPLDRLLLVQLSPYTSAR